MAIILQSADDSAIAPLTKEERDLVHKLRAMLKDVPEEQFRSLNTLVEKQRGQRWSDELLLIYLQIAMQDINAEPPLTLYTILTVPISWHGCVLNGAFIMSLFGEAVVQNGESFSYSDNGISLNINQAAGYLQIAQAMHGAYQKQKENLKRSLRPNARALKYPSAPTKIRSYAQRLWIYR
nr:MAG TPA: hypothetical protein [Caudoviricetes sp.]